MPEEKVEFETTTIPMVLKEFAPPAAPLHVSDPQPAQNFIILEVGANWVGQYLTHHRPE